MAAPVVIVANQLTFEVAGTQLECQVFGFTLAWADQTQNLDRTACPEGAVVLPSDQATAQATLTVDILMDWSVAGWSSILAGVAGTEVAATLVVDSDKPDYTRHYTGTILAPRLPETWRTRQAQRQESLALSCVTWDGPTPGTPTP